MTSDAERAGALIRRSIGSGQSSSARARARARLVETVERNASRGASRRRVLGWSLAMAGALASIAVVVLLTRPWKNDALTFEVGRAGHPGHAGQYYSTLRVSPLPLTFSDGSVVTLAPDSAVRVARATADRVVVHLENGAAELSVRHRAGARWEVHAGPYTVLVTGTEFRIAWDNHQRRITVEMRSGEVLVTGPGVEGGVRVRDTERFVSRSMASVERAKEEGEPAAPNDDAGSTSRALPGPKAATGTKGDDPGSMAPADDPSSEASASGKAESTRGSELAARAFPDSSKDWGSLARAGKYAAIVDDAERRGLDGILNSAPAADLEALADAARLAGRRALAERALLGLRRRFPGSASSADAAFILGKLSEQGGNSAQALSWYQRHVDEGGSLAPEALGRRMLLFGHLGQQAASRRAAEEYLQRFPEGTYSSQARDLLEGARVP